MSESNVNGWLNSRPYLPKCHYCDVDFDVIGKIEDFEEDVAYIAKKRNLTDRLGLMNHVQNENPEKNKMSKRERREKYMSQLSLEMVQDLYELYKIDFEMFGYE